jgi:uncharacterized protein (TIGR02302 family)
MTESTERPDGRTAAGERRRGASARHIRYGGRLALSWLALVWERVWPRLWPLVTLAGLFLAVALFDVLPDLAGWLHTAILAAFALAALVALGWMLPGLRPPGRDEARRRLEITSGLSDRPLATVEDELAVGTGEPAAEALWQAHQRRMRARTKALRVGAPAPEVARRDPWALRGVVLVLLALALVTGWSDAGSRLSRVFMPAFEPTSSEPLTIEAWLTPPDYTGLPPRMVTGDNGSKPIKVPDGTRIMIQVHGGRGRPHLTFGKQDIKLDPLGRTAYQGEVLAKFPGRLVVRQRGRDIIDWPIGIIADRAPTIKFAKKPGVTARASIRLDYAAKDDYRIAAVRAYIARAGDVDVIKLKIPAAGAKTAKGTYFHDLSGHRWAGLDVAVVLEVEDDAGHFGHSRVMEMTLPERTFHHPVARAIIRLRKMLAEDPTNVDRVVSVLGAIASQPKAFSGDPVVYLALRSIQGRLILGSDHDGRSDSQLRAGTGKAIREVSPIMWQTALRIEEGITRREEQRLAELRRKLMQALQRKNVKDPEVRKLLKQLREAMRKYMEALRRDMAQHPEKYARRRIDPNAPTYTPQDMRQMMQRMLDMLNQGNKEALKRMLSDLQRQMQNLRFAQPNQQRLDPNHPAMRMMRRLSDLIRRQQKLMDESFRRGQQRREGQPRDPKADQKAQQEQRALRRQLGEMMRKLGDMTGRVPQNFGKAERQMRKAERQLKNGNPGRAVGPQGRALRELQRGSRQAMRSLARRFGLSIGTGPFANRSGQRRFGQDRDPLGRRLDGMGPLDTDDVKVPTEAQRKKAREILEELRRRSGQSDRPKLERQYIDRLLRRF